MSKLDRFLVSEDFYDSFPHITGVILEKGTPDHRPILLKEHVADFGPPPFRFFHPWPEMDGFHNLVVETWNNDGIADTNGLISFKKKLQHLKRVIREWIVIKRLDSSKLKKEHLSRLLSIDNMIDQGLVTSLDLFNRHEPTRILGDLNRLEEGDHAKKARIKWALEGDENTSFFHAMIKKNSHQLAIKGILNEGEWIKIHKLSKMFFLIIFGIGFISLASLLHTLMLTCQILFPVINVSSWSVVFLRMKLRGQYGIVVETLPRDLMGLHLNFLLPLGIFWNLTLFIL